MLGTRPGSARLVDVTRPQLLLTDRAATRGDGVFESLLFRGGRVRALEAHLERLAASAAALDLPVPAASVWREALELALGAFTGSVEPALPDAAGSRPAGGAAAAVGASAGGAAGASGTSAPGHSPAPSAASGPTGTGPSEATVKLVASRGPEHPAPGSDGGTYWVSVTPLLRGPARGPENGLAVVLLERGVDAELARRAPWLLAGVKTLSYAVNLAAQRWARAQGADDAVFVTADGQVLEGATSSVLVARRGEDGRVLLRTPETEAGILAGTTQSAAFEAGLLAGWDVEYGALRREDLLAADAVWLVSSVRLAAAVTSVDGAAVRCDPQLHRVLSAGLEQVL